MRVLYFGTYRAEYARNQILLEGLRRAGMDVIECHETLWHGVDDRLKVARGGWFKPQFISRALRVYYRLIRKYTTTKDYDVLIVGYPGHFDVFLARLLSWLRKKPLVWDVLNSLYLITKERGIHKTNPVTGWIIRQLEGLACRLPDLLLLDTSLFVDWFHQTHRVNTQKFRIVQIGADERFFYPADTEPTKDGIFRVIYYGSYIPNHGVDTIVAAANLLSTDPHIHFSMIGAGPDLENAHSLVREAQLSNVIFMDWMDRDALRQQIALSDLVLGVFGTSLQNTITNNNKIYEGFAMRKPVISARTDALPDILRHGEHLYLCTRGDPASLAEGILVLSQDHHLRQRLAESGYEIFTAHFDISHIGQQFAAHLHELTRRSV